MPFGPLGLLFDLLGLAAQHEEESRRKADVRRVLEQVAAACEGSVCKSWFGRVRVRGHAEGRELEVIYQGSGVVEVRCRAPSGLTLSLERAGFFRRLFGDDAPRVQGGGPQAEGARGLFHRYGGRWLRVRDGQLVARMAPGLQAQAITAPARELAQLPWREPTLSVSARAAEPGVRASPASAAGLRCPFCHEHLPAEALVVHCAGCDAPYHPACFEEGDGCSIPGCGQRTSRGGRVKA